MKFYFFFFLIHIPFIHTMESSGKSKKLSLLSCFHKKTKKNTSETPPSLPPSNPVITPELPPQDEKIKIAIPSSSPRLNGKNDCSRTTISSGRKSSRSYKPADFKTIVEPNTF